MKSNCFPLLLGRREKIRLTKKRIAEVLQVFPDFYFRRDSVNSYSIIVISKGYNFVVSFCIICKVYVSINPVNPGSIVAGEHRGI